jgi:hypothetical protein
MALPLGGKVSAHTALFCIFRFSSLVWRFKFDITTALLDESGHLTLKPFVVIAWMSLCFPLRSAAAGNWRKLPHAQTCLVCRTVLPPWDGVTPSPTSCCPSFSSSPSMCRCSSCRHQRYAPLPALCLNFAAAGEKQFLVACMSVDQTSFLLVLAFLAHVCFCEASSWYKPNAISYRLRDWLGPFRLLFSLNFGLSLASVCLSKANGAKELTTVVRAPDAERAVVCSSLLRSVWRWRREATKACPHLTYPCSCVQSQDPAQKQSQAILKFLPLMIGYFSLSVPSGLSLYW